MTDQPQTSIILADAVYTDLQQLADLLNLAVTDEALYQKSMQSLENIHSQITAITTAFKATLEKAIEQRDGAYEDLAVIEDITNMDSDQLEEIEDLESNGAGIERNELQDRVFELRKLALAVENQDSDHPAIEELLEDFREQIMDDPYWMMMDDDYFPLLSEDEQMEKAVSETITALRLIGNLPDDPATETKIQRVARALVHQTAGNDYFQISRNPHLKETIQAMIAALPEE